MPPSKGVIILGSARGDGNTSKAAAMLGQLNGYDVVDLNQFRIGQYDYLHRNQDDDFASLTRRLAEQYDTWIFATPVYWYSMSGVMKAFFDRLTDLLDLHPLKKRALQGKRMGLLYCSSDSELIEGFEIPFRETAIYLSMPWLGFINTWVKGGELPEEVVAKIHHFADALRVNA